MKANVTARFLLILFLGVSLSACDQIRERLASIISPQTAPQALDSVRQNIGIGKFKEAASLSENYSNNVGPYQADFALASAQAFSNLGDPNKALYYLAIAIDAGLTNKEALIVDPNFELIRTDIRFVSLLAGRADQFSHQNPKSNLNSAISSDSKGNGESTSIRIDDQKTEVKAGNVSIKLTN